MQSPVTIEKMDLAEIQQGSSAEVFDGLSKIKGVITTTGSLTFTAINTRGFATISNTRFVTLLDGMDLASPLLNFSFGNFVGMSELDMENMELVPGASSALYGPNAFNGILFMNSKNPFEYQGLSVNAKTGLTNSEAAGQIDPYNQVSIRYAKAFKNKFAFKINLSSLFATDWRANNYSGDRVFNAKNTPNSANFDGMNRYGDESQLALPLILFTPQIAQVLTAQGVPAAQASSMALGALTKLGTIDVRRTGFKELDIADHMKASSIKGDIALHYKITEKIEASYNYRFGIGNTVFQGGERYFLRDHTTQFHRLEVKGNNFFLRAYMSQAGAGGSFNMSALGAFANERIYPTLIRNAQGGIAGGWLPSYAGAYINSLLPTVLGGGTPTDQQIAAAHAQARLYADAGAPNAQGQLSQGATRRPVAGSAEFNSLMSSVRSAYFQRNPPGAGFIDNSRMWHVEGSYNFKDQIKFAEILVGGNLRRYDIFSDGTIFNEDSDGDGKTERVVVDEMGAYLQVSKKMMEERLKFTASIRYDKNQNFKGQINPRASLVYSAGSNQNHNFRLSYQTGFRNPEMNAQFIFFPLSAGYLLGSVQANAERYGLFNGGSYTEASYRAFIASGGKDATLLKTANINYVQPEQLTAFEIGYKGVLDGKLMIDLNYYYNFYNNFIVNQNVYSKNTVTHQGKLLNNGQPFAAFRVYTNSSVLINSQGLGLGLTYKLPKGFMLTGNYNWTDFSLNSSDVINFDPQFNTPKHRFVLGVNNKGIIENMSFDISYRWQDQFLWQSAFGQGMVDAYGVMDAQVSYKVKKAKTIFKIGANNLLGKDYLSTWGGPYVGQLYYFGITFDQFMN